MKNQNSFVHNTALFSLVTSAEQLKKHWPWYLALGIALVIVGTLALFYSVVTTIVSVMYLGIALLFIGLVEIIQAFRVRQLGSFFVHLLVGLLYLIVGGLMVFYPAANALSLTLLLAAFFMVIGLFRIIFSFTFHGKHWLAILLNGILTFALGALILYQWPLSSFWAIGVLIAVDMIITGWVWAILALRVRAMPQIPN